MIMNIEVFSCSGGMAEGFRRAGVAFDFAFDFNADACDSYEANLGHRPVRMDARDLLRLARAGWRPVAVEDEAGAVGDGEIDLFVCDPPCTPWSRAGKRLGTADERDMLGDTVELIALLRPRAYLIGNVPGLNDSDQWHHVQRYIGGLVRHGYCVADYAQLDAAAYGVPQHRIRPFWFGHLEGPCISWPLPTHGEPTRELAFPGMELQPYVTCRQALGHLPLHELGRPVRLRRRPTERTWDNHPPSRPDAPAMTVKCNGGRDSQGGSMLAFTLERGSAPKRKTDRRPASEKAQGNRIGSADEVSKTVTARPSRVGAGAAHVVEWGRARDCNGNQSEDGTEFYSQADEPAHVVGTSTLSDGNVLAIPEHLVNDRHLPSDPDQPSKTLLAKSRDNGACALRLDNPNQPPADPDEPHRTVTVAGRGAQAAVQWPWDRPATTVQRDERIGPPGHHSAKAWQSHPNAVILSERAAALLQGFPPGWRFIGKTKKARWGQLGQAMPPPLAEAVARSVRRQLEATGITQRLTVPAPTGIQAGTHATQQADKTSSRQADKHAQRAAANDAAPAAKAGGDA